MDDAAWRIDVRRKALVILHISGVDVVTCGFDLSLEFTEEVFRRFAEDIDQDIETSPVRHPDDNFSDSRRSRDLNQLLQSRNQGLAPFQGETLLTNEPGMQIALQPFCCRQALEQVHSLRHELRWLVSHGLLHLLGWDHPDDPSLEAMLQLQEQLLDSGGNVQARRDLPVESDINGHAH